VVKVLFALHVGRDPRGAVYADTVRRASFLEQRGHRALVLTRDELGAGRRLPPRLAPLWMPLALRRLLRRHRDLDLAVCHSWLGWGLVLPGRPRGRARRLPVAIQFHGLEPLAYAATNREGQAAGHPFHWRFRLLHGAVIPALLRASCQRADAVWCLNRGEERYLVEQRWAPAARVQVLPNPAPEGENAPRRHPPRARRLAFLGQWLANKGVRYLVAAFTGLADRHPGLTLVALGTRAPAEAVLASFPAALHPRVRVVMEAGREELAAELAGADLFVFPTLSEGSSLALLEAMAAGLPIVATAVGAAPDQLAQGRDALLVPPADGRALERAIEGLLDDPARREELGENARQRARELSWERLAEPWLATVEAVAARGAPR
jgi:glycosyltransferase involved in cell wall biosynthesis